MCVKTGQATAYTYTKNTDADSNYLDLKHLGTTICTIITKFIYLTRLHNKCDILDFNINV